MSAQVSFCCSRQMYLYIVSKFERSIAQTTTKFTDAQTKSATMVQGLPYIEMTLTQISTWVACTHLSFIFILFWRVLLCYNIISLI